MKTKRAKRLIKYALYIILLTAVFTAAVNLYVVSSTSPYIISESSLQEKDRRDLLVVLGSRVNSEGQPQEMLRLRLEKTLSLYSGNFGDFILCSGDNRAVRNHETDAMRLYLTESGADEEYIYVDETGYNTYGSISGLLSDYQGKSVIIITQKYHLYRALYIAHTMSIDAIGIPADTVNEGMLYRQAREMLARLKDFILCLTD